MTTRSAPPGSLQSRTPLKAVTAQTGLQEVVDVAFGIDENFAPHMAAAIASIVDNAKGAQFRFIILHTGFSEDTRSTVERVAPTARFTWIEIPDSDLPQFKIRALYTRAILFRLGLEQRAPADCRRVIYLDADLIVLGDLRDLWRQDLGSNPIGAVEDTFAHLPSYPLEFAKRWGLPPEDGEYVNSGILLINLEQVRRERSFSKVLAFIAEHGGDLLFADQDALNAVFWGRCQKLGIEWNIQRDMVVPSVSALLPDHKRLNGRRPAIVHFCDVHKPWLPTGYHPWSWLYWYYLAQTPFTREVASTYGITLAARLRLWLRWLRRHPYKRFGVMPAPLR